MDKKERIDNIEKHYTDEFLYRYNLHVISQSEIEDESEEDNDDRDYYGRIY